MNVSHTIKDKEVPRWYPLRRIYRLNLPKLSFKRILLLVLVAAALLSSLTPTYVNRTVITDLEETDEEVLLSLRRALNSTFTLHGDFSTSKPAAIFATAHDLYNASGITALACEMASAKEMNVLIMFLGMDSVGGIPQFLRAHQFSPAACPMAWHDARYKFSSLIQQKSAAELLLSDAVSYFKPSVAVYLDDEQDWFMQSLERVVYWRLPAISLIQLKRTSLPNLRWVAHLNARALESELAPPMLAENRLEYTTNRCRDYDFQIQHRHIISTDRFFAIGPICSTRSSSTLRHIQSKHYNPRNPQTAAKMARRSIGPTSPNNTPSQLLSWGVAIVVSFR